MKISEPIGPCEWSGFFLRLPLGFFMLFAGLKKIDNLEQFIETVKSFGIINNEFANITIGFLFPWIEIFVSALLILGLWNNLVCVLGMILVGSIIFAFGIFPEGVPFNKDVIIFFVFLALMFSGPGRLSLDGVKRTG